MKRLPIEVGISVFAFSVVSELFCIQILRGSLNQWLNHPNRRLLLIALILVNLLNASIAMYFSARAVNAEIRLRRNQEKQKDAGLFLNHHLRNALSVIQNAAFLTNDQQTIKLCDDAVTRIVNVLVSAEAGLNDPSESVFRDLRAPGRPQRG